MRLFTTPAVRKGEVGPYMRIKGFLFLAYLILSLSAWAQDPQQPSSEPLPFGLWKEHQVVEAKNQVVRLSNRIHLLKTGRYKMESVRIDGEPLLGSAGEKEYQDLKASASGVDDDTLKKAEAKVLKSVEDKMKMALENLQYAKELSIDDYLVVYLSRFKDDAEALQRVVGKLSQEELVEILKVQISKDSGGRRPKASATVLSNIKAAEAGADKAPKSL